MLGETATAPNPNGLPGWLARAEGEASARVRSFILKFCDGVRDYRNVAIDRGEFLTAGPPATPFCAENLEWSGFTASKDSYFYSRLLEEAVRRYGRTHAFVDLATGSAIPLLSVFGRGLPIDGFRAEVYDVDPEAVAVAARNVRTCGLESAVRVGRRSIVEFFSDRDSRSLEKKVVCANPPYVPFAKTPVPDWLLAIAGGPDGLDHTRPFLSADYPADARLVLEWSSLARPVEVFGAIERRFEVEYARAAEVALGKYTRDRQVYPGLAKARREGKCVFDGNANGGAQILFGAILRPRGRG